MADSAITYTGIDEEFPVPGQDNDSQGFRDNFSQIKTGLETAKLELTDLLTSVARTDTANDFNGNNIEDANLIAVSGAIYQPADLVSDTQVEWNDGVAQKFNITSGLTLTFTNFPTGGQKYASTRLILKGNGGTHTVNFETGGNGNLYINNLASAVNSDGDFVVSDTSQPHVFDVWSDNGLDIYIDYIGQFMLQA
jgi:hypothetical protein